MRSAIAIARGAGAAAGRREAANDGSAFGAGVGLRLPHLREVATRAPAVGWLEVHPENFLANPHAAELLREIALQRPVAMHSVGLSVGSAAGIDRAHLERMRRFFADIDPPFVSGHLAWSTHGGAYLNDLLPLPYDDESLRIVSEHVHEVQEALGRRYVVENPASYVGFGASTMTEVEFLAELTSATGCGLLCDVSNVHVSAANMGYDAYAYVDAFPAHAVVEIHLGGFTAEADAASQRGEVLIDTHSAPIASAVWDLYAHALRRFGPRPTLIEWDNDLPTLETLVAEAARAEAVAASVVNEVSRDAVAR
jgi:uncharacterized protein (UPF0276 family)